MGRAALLGLLGLVACRTLPTTPAAVLDAVHLGTHVVGEPVALGRATVFNREDLVWDAKVSPDGRQVAFARLGMRSYFLAVHDGAGAKLRDTAINDLEFDVEALEFSPDSKTIATASRDGAVRVFDAATGQLRAAWLTEEPLVSLAFDATGAWLAMGSASGLVTVTSVPSLSFVAEVRGHADEVRGLAFGPDGSLFSGGWDQRVSVWTLGPALEGDRTVRAHVERKNGSTLVRAVVDSRVSAAFAIDARAPGLVIRSSLAQALGLTPGEQTVSLVTPLGTQLAHLVPGRSLSLKGLTFEGLDLAVCDACVPAEAQGVLGASFLAGVELAFDEATHEVQLTARGPVRAGERRRLSLARSFSFPAPVNDLSLDAQGRVLGLAFSETKAKRTREIYEREKKQVVEPEREWDCAARVDAATGTVLQRVHGHHGVVATAGISPDGKTLATGGWDKRVVVHAATELVDSRAGWAVRRVRFSADGLRLVIAAWTRINVLGDHQSDPAASTVELIYGPEAGVAR
jgi:WD40 repeat protein